MRARNRFGYSPACRPAAIRRVVHISTLALDHCFDQNIDATFPLLHNPSRNQPRVGHL